MNASQFPTLEQDGAPSPRTETAAAARNGIPGLNRMTASTRARCSMFALAATMLAFWTTSAWRALDGHSPEHLRIFGSFWASGWALTHQLNPYAAYPQTWHYVLIGKHPLTIFDLNLSPPALMPLFQLISGFSPYTAVKVWTLFSALAILAMIASLVFASGRLPQQRQLLWLLMCPIVIDTLALSEDWALLAIAVTAAWLLLQRDKEFTAGLIIGVLAAAKPNFLVWPLFLLFRGQKRTAIVAFSTTAVLSAIPILLYGPAIYLQWMQAIGGDVHFLIPTDISIPALATDLGLPNVGRVLAVLLIASAGWFIVARRPSLEATTGLALCLAILASPIAWMQYTLFLVPVLLNAPWSRRLTLAAIPMLLPTNIAVALVRFPTASLITHCCYFIPVCCFALHFLRSGMGDGVPQSETGIVRNHILFSGSPHPASVALATSGATSHAGAN
jgi:hypothetical protein